LYNRVSLIFQLPHDRLDDVLINAIEEGDLDVAGFDRASMMGGNHYWIF